MKNSKAYSRQYRKENREKLLESNRKWRENNREKYREYFRKRRKTIEGKYSRYKYRAGNMGREFTLTFEQFKTLISGKCHYCGTSKRLGVDRKDNFKGYTLLNSVSCCWGCNKLKGSIDYNSFVKRCKLIAKHLGQK